MIDSLLLLQSLDCPSPFFCPYCSYSAHIFGIVGSNDGKLTSIQNLLQSWVNGTCLSFEESIRLLGLATFTTPLIQSNRTISSAKVSLTSVATKLRARAECRTIQVESGTGCPELAVKCSISPADFTKYNLGATFCSDLKPKQHVCCSAGTLPDFSPKQNADSSCFSYEVKEEDNCDNLAAENSITKEKIQEFNKNT